MIATDLLRFVAMLFQGAPSLPVFVSPQTPKLSRQSNHASYTSTDARGQYHFKHVAHIGMFDKHLIKP